MKTWKSTAVGLLLPITSLMAQTTDSALTEQSLQITLFSPMGTNGQNADDVVNNLSLNIVAGLNGGLEGVEVGGFANLLKHDMEGIQLAGFANMVGGEAKGIQLAGFSNVNAGTSSGIMIAGFTNHAGAVGECIQIAGFSNQCMSGLTGSQLAGFTNLSPVGARGIQLAGFGNYSGQHSRVTQVAGFANATTGNIEGSQVAGFLNHAGNVNGVQASGFLNTADTVTGMQIGFINVSDSFSAGLPIGFLNVSRSGRRALILQTNELLWLEMQGHTGVDKFYNIFALALKPVGPQPGWAVGYGIGTTAYKADRLAIRLEGIAYHVNENRFWTPATNTLVRLNALAEFSPKSDKFGLRAGPSLNILTSSRTDYYGENFNASTPPYSILSATGTYFETQAWIGAQAGITF